MSQLIARILLAIFLWPLAALVYIIVLVLMMQLARGSYYPDREVRAFALAGAAAWIFIGCYWILLWRKSVQWTVRRRAWTFGAIAAALACAAVVGGVMGPMIEADFGWFMGSITAPTLWVVATVLIWRENASERAARLANAGRDTIVCPTCGYNLTGLRETRCPECGAQFTVDQLYAAQPARAQAELNE